MYIYAGALERHSLIHKRTRTHTYLHKYMYKILLHTHIDLHAHSSMHRAITRERETEREQREVWKGTCMFSHATNERSGTRDGVMCVF